MALRGGDRRGEIFNQIQTFSLCGIFLLLLVILLDFLLVCQIVFVLALDGLPLICKLFFCLLLLEGREEKSE